MTVKITSKEVIYCSSLGAVTVYTKVGQFGYIVLATFANVHYFYPVRVFHVQQPHLFLLTVVFVTSVPSSTNKAYSIRLQKTFTQDIFACRCDSN